MLCGAGKKHTHGRLSLPNLVVYQHRLQLIYPGVPDNALMALDLLPNQGDQRSRDIYAAGLIFYLVLTGRIAFQASTGK